MNLKAIVNIVYFITRPLLVGIASGIAGGILVVLLSKLLSFGYSTTQEILAFTGFVIMGALFGISDSIHNFLAWLQYRKRPKKAFD